MQVSAALAQVDAPIDIPGDLLGPLGALVGALVVVGVLWRFLLWLLREYINSLVARADRAEQRAAASDDRLDKFGGVLEQLLKAVERLEARKP